jgi:hypothetical protein
VIDRLDSRVLAAVRFVDVTTGAPLLGNLNVSADGVAGVRNRSGLFVITHVDGFEDYEASFTAPPPPPPPPSPPLGFVTVSLTASDPLGRYLPRVAHIALPRDPDPAGAAAPASLFQPIEVALYPSPTAASDPGWALVRASVRRKGNGATDGLPGAFLRVVSAADATNVLARGFADGRGEAFVPIAGLPAVVWGATADSPVLARQLDAVIDAYFDPAAGAGPSDPEGMEASRATLPTASAAISLSSGREISVLLEIAVP